MLFTIASALALAASAQAAPFFGSKVETFSIEKRAEGDASNYNKSMHSISKVQIHESCNAAQTAYLRNGLNEMVTLARHAHDRILRLGEEDDLYRLYFGNASSASAAGLYAQIAYGNKPGVLLRCDDPDGNCKEVTAEGTWAGHWRGKNNTAETVICSRTYTSRLLLGGLCFDGNMIGLAAPSAWLATDLLHRMMHIPQITYNHVEHASDSYAGCLELAATNNSAAAFNQNTFQYYAIDAYARDVAYPPMGCVAANATEVADDHSHGSSSHVSSSAASATSAVIATAGAASATTTAAESCHTHSDGIVHCS